MSDTKVITLNNLQEFKNKSDQIYQAKLAFDSTPTTSSTNPVTSDGIKSYADTKFSKAGGNIAGNVSITGNLSVSGTATAVDTQSLSVKDTIITTNATGVDLVDYSGIAIKTNATDVYGILYDVSSDAVLLGLGKLASDNKFTYNTDAASPIAIRSDASELTAGHTLKWDATKNRLVDSGYSMSDKLDKMTSTGNYEAYTMSAAGVESLTTLATGLVANSITVRDANNKFKVGSTQSSDDANTVTSKDYIDNRLSITILEATD